MSRFGLKGLLPAAALLLVVTAGYGAGGFLRQAECSALVDLACLAAGILAVSAWCRLSLKAEERFASLGLIAYLVATVASEALLFVQDARQVLVSIGWLFPLVVGGTVLPRWDAWLAAAGCWATLFGGVVALAYNVSHEGSGVGFFVNWIE